MDGGAGSDRHGGAVLPVIDARSVRSIPAASRDAFDLFAQSAVRCGELHLGERQVNARTVNLTTVTDSLGAPNMLVTRVRHDPPEYVLLLEGLRSIY
jgi:hypothetical protein